MVDQIKSYLLTAAVVFKIFLVGIIYNEVALELVIGHLRMINGVVHRILV